MEVYLRSVEGAVPLVDDIFKTHFVKSHPEALGCSLPVLLVADMVLGHGGQLDMVLKSEQAVDLVDKPYDALYLGGYLLVGHEDVSVVLSEAPYPHKTVKLAALLVAVDKPKLANSHRKVTVRPGLRLVDKHSARAVHRLDGIVGVVYYGGVHILLVMLPVARGLPQMAV